MNDPHKSAPLTVAIAGLGTVGVGTLRVLADQAPLLSQRAGRPIVVTAVSARDHNRDRGIDLSSYTWYADPVAMVHESTADVVVELIGGSEGAARRVVEAALDAGRSVVTANKALLAHHGLALARRAEATGGQLMYEAAVAGGIPIIKALREGLAANEIRSVQGILNGTCNFILTTMRETRRSFEDVLAEAQDLGYAEADPSFDIDGIDAAHKLALLASLAFRQPVDLAAVSVQGIRHVSALDIRFAGELGYRIKLLASGERSAGGVVCRVAPVMVPLNAPLAHVEGVYNAVVTEGDFVGRSVFEGRGAGAGPTASAVVADLVDLARGRFTPTLGVPVDALTQGGSIVGPCLSAERYYVRLMVLDRPGVFADVADVLRAEGVSMESILQQGRDPGETVPVVMILHETDERVLQRVISRIATLETVVEPPRVIRIGRF